MTAAQKQCLLCWMGCLDASGIDGLWGSASADATRKLQKKLGLTQDGIWGSETDRAVREFISSAEAVQQKQPEEEDSFWKHIRYWRREEFRCRCGEYHEPYCDGFPAEPDQTLVELLDDIRAHFGRPAHRSSGIRCLRHNRDSKGVSNSKHLYGKAMDFFIEGVSGEALRAYAASDPRCNYTYVIEGQYVHLDVA